MYLSHSFQLQPEYTTSLLKENYCYSYADTQQFEPCMQKGYTIVRLFLWLLGTFGELHAHTPCYLA